MSLIHKENQKSINNTFSNLGNRAGELINRNNGGDIKNNIKKSNVNKTVILQQYNERPYKNLNIESSKEMISNKKDSQIVNYQKKNLNLNKKDKDYISDDYEPNLQKSKEKKKSLISLKNSESKLNNVNITTSSNSLVKINKSYNLITININPIFKEKNPYCKIVRKNNILINKRALNYEDGNIIIDGNCLVLNVLKSSLNDLHLNEEKEFNNIEKIKLIDSKIKKKTKNGKHKELDEGILSESLSYLSKQKNGNKSEITKSINSSESKNNTNKSNKEKDSFNDEIKLTDSKSVSKKSKLKKKRKNHKW